MLYNIGDKFEPWGDAAETVPILDRSIVPHPVEGFLNVEEGTPGSISTVEPVDNPIGQTEELVVCRRFASEPVLEVWDKVVAVRMFLKS
ncbi:hypothetical protein TNCV_2049961 [Trichonephila clavipes]|nr:hypothetical protein TNCV_2049961 [Trichonephila clavipes]